MISPVIVFAYNRPDHLKKVLEALSKNELAAQSDLYIMIDGPKNEKGLIANKEVMKVAEEYRTGFFKSCTINNHSKNSGLAKSVISGVSQNFGAG